eukprot:TRINITY_DN1904_c0_g1_i1.p1 TRINITY_DN1904_c0_g1~~TRINITY_DN1904_c0_g1_i1.p1  ORF type:complete len:278 (+),score=64.58 TRINITY_DN1904_c0_g1_i1:75-908(+)
MTDKTETEMTSINNLSTSSSSVTSSSSASDEKQLKDDQNASSQNDDKGAEPIDKDVKRPETTNKEEQDETTKQELYLDLKDKILHLKVSILLILFVDFVVLFVFSNGEIRTILCCLLLAVLCIIGLRGVLRLEMDYIKIYWLGTYIWLGLVVLFVVLYLSLGAIKDIAATRCEVQQMFEQFGKDCLAQMQSCKDSCVYEVKQRLTIEAGFLAVVVLSIIAYIATQAKKLHAELVALFPELQDETPTESSATETITSSGASVDADASTVSSAKVEHQD